MRLREVCPLCGEWSWCGRPCKWRPAGEVGVYPVYADFTLPKGTPRDILYGPCESHEAVSPPVLVSPQSQTGTKGVSQSQEESHAKKPWEIAGVSKATWYRRKGDVVD